MKSRLTMRKIKIFMGLLMLLVLLGVILFFLREFISNYFLRMSLNDIKSPGLGDRVLVFAPHNDDEVLGAADLIAKTLENGGQVKVVMMTNGDGYKNAIELDYLKLMPKPGDYINFGYTRQKETINALESLKLSRQNIIFLGYPDGGLSELWSGHWDPDKPYRSIYTKASATPYENSMHKNAAYTGTNVVSDIRSIILDYKPTHIVYPHPNDRHPDHWGTNAFVKYVLAEAKYKPRIEWLYLVHRGDWPTPLKKDPRLFLVPPAKLADMGTDWYALPMETRDINRKENAILTYKSQLSTLKLLLTAFERKNELFGEYKDLKISNGKADDSDISPGNGNRVIMDPSKDTLELEINGESDLLNVYTEVSRQGNLHIFVETRSKIETHTRYLINLVLFEKNNTHHLDMEVKNNHIVLKKYSRDSIQDASVVKAVSEGRLLHVVIPVKDLGTVESFMLNVQSSPNVHILDRTAWRKLIF